MEKEQRQTDPLDFTGLFRFVFIILYGHTHATMLLKMGVNPKIVQERIGHGSIKITMDTYSHVLPDMQNVAVEALQALFSGKKQTDVL